MTSPPPAECPFRGLQPYTESDREYFFGRERDRVVIASNLIASPLTILYGGSGVGKTSVLLASVVPYLETVPHITPVIFRAWQGAGFASALRAEVLEAVGRVARGGVPGADSFGPPLPLDELLLRCARAAGGRLLFVFDQFEEYFLNKTSMPEVECFETEFARVVNRQDVNAHFLLCLREEELSKLDRFQGRIPNLLNNTLRVERLSRRAAEDAIRNPLKRYNRKFELPDELKVSIEDGLVEALLDKATPGRSGPPLSAPPAGGAPHSVPTAEGVETPVLQLLLTRLWATERRQGSNVLRLQTFNEQLGGAEKIVSTYLNEVMGGLTETERDVAARVFQFLVTPSGTKIAMDPKTLAGWAGLEGEQAEKQVTDLLEKLSSHQPTAPSDERADLRHAHVLRKVTAPQQPDRYEIFHDALGGAIRGWRAEYLQTKLAWAEQVKRWLTVAVLILLVAGAFSGWRAYSARMEAGEAEMREKIVEAELLSRKIAEQVKASDRTIPFLQAVMRGHTDEVNFVSFGPDPRLLITAGADGSAQLWDTQLGELKYELQGHVGPVNCAGFSGDGKFVVTGGADRTARVWDAGDGLPFRVLSGHEGEISYAAFAAGGRLIVTASRDSTARVWDAATGDLRHTLRGHVGPLNAAALSGAQGLLVTASADGTARLWDVDAGRELRVFRVGQNLEVSRAAFSPDGRLIITAGADKTARLWETGTGKLLRTLQGHTGEVKDAAFSGDGTWVVTISQDKTARVWEADSGRLLTVLVGHTDALTSLDVSRVGNLIATASRDQTARVWNVSELSTIRITQPVLAAEPSSYSGRCPVNIKFTGSIIVVGTGGRVKYQFVRSSREVTPVQELTFDSPGAKEVSDTWRVPGSGTVYGWETLKILEPQPAESNKAEFRLQCSQPAATPTPEDETPPDSAAYLVGRVRDETGMPIPHALIYVGGVGGGGPFTRKILTDATGEFKVGLPGGPSQIIQIFVRAMGYRSYARYASAGASGVTRVDIILQRLPPTPQPSP